MTATTEREFAKPRRQRKPPALPKRQTKGWHVISWIETHCVHTQGKWIGQTFKLLPWQKEVILELFEINPTTGLRRYRWALIGIAKKAGKTELMAALGLYLLIGDGEPAPLGACAAASDDQADLVFGAAKTMCRLSPTLKHITDPRADEILVPSIPGAKLQRVAAAGGTKDGPSWQFLILDELHEWTLPKHVETWNILTNGVGARDQPLILQITTAGVAGSDSICERQYLRGKAVEAGRDTGSPTKYFKWWSAPPDADYRDPESWKAASPSYGITVQEAFYVDQLEEKTENMFRRYFLNQWTESLEVWLPLWGECHAPAIKVPKHTPVWVGVDIGLKNDSSAVSWAARIAGRIVLQSHTWSAIPAQPADEHVAGGRIHLSSIERFIRRLRKRYDLREVAYDPRFFERSAEILSDEGVTMVEVSQSSASMADAYQGFHDGVTQGVIAWGGEGADVLNRHVRSTAAEQTDRGWKVRKLRNGKIDATVAAVLAHYRAAASSDDAGGVQWYDPDPEEAAA